MAKAKNHSSHHRNRLDHRNGIKRPRTFRERKLYELYPRFRRALTIKYRLSDVRKHRVNINKRVVHNFVNRITKEQGNTWAHKQFYNQALKTQREKLQAKRKKVVAKTQARIEKEKGIETSGAKKTAKIPSVGNLFRELFAKERKVKRDRRKALKKIRKARARRQAEKSGEAKAEKKEKKEVKKGEKKKKPLSKRKLKLQETKKRKAEIQKKREELKKTPLSPEKQKKYDTIKRYRLFRLKLWAINKYRNAAIPKPKPRIVYKKWARPYSMVMMEKKRKAERDYRHKKLMEQHQKTKAKYVLINKKREATNVKRVAEGKKPLLLAAPWRTWREAQAAEKKQLLQEIKGMKPDPLPKPNKKNRPVPKRIPWNASEKEEKAIRDKFGKKNVKKEPADAAKKEGAAKKPAAAKPKKNAAKKPAAPKDAKPAAT